MQWHIITGSKGGIGKTLITLLLLAYHLDKQESVLVLDLNGMNTDSASMLLYDKKLGRPLSIPVLESKSKHLTVQKTFSVDGSKPHHYVVAWPRNPFELYNRISFVHLLKTIRHRAEELVTELNKQPEGEKISPLSHVFIDTNYHFCNIFGSDNSHYTPYTELQEENITVWFLWIYRQLDKLLHETERDENRLVMSTAAAIERHLKGHPFPLMHVFTPVAMEPPKDLESGVMSNLAMAFFQALTRNKDYVIKELSTLEQKPMSSPIPFQGLIDKFRQADITVEGQEDPHLLFIDTLVKLFSQNNTEESQRPRNILPLSTYEFGLKYYTDKKRKDAVARLREFETYKSFVKLYEGKE